MCWAMESKRKISGNHQGTKRIFGLVSHGSLCYFARA
jgi:hypothetical protein